MMVLFGFLCTDILLFFCLLFDGKETKMLFFLVLSKSRVFAAGYCMGVCLHGKESHGVLFYRKGEIKTF